MVDRFDAWSLTLLGAQLGHGSTSFGDPARQVRCEPSPLIGDSLGTAYGQSCRGRAHEPCTVCILAGDAIAIAVNRQRIGRIRPQVRSSLRLAGGRPSPSSKHPMG